MTLPPDHQHRALALEPHRSFCVQSPAGSGKTELLTQRILKLLTVCDQPEEILAITFTRKAAAEMRNRLLENLQKAAAISDHELATLPAHQLGTLALAREVLARDRLLDWSLMDNTSRLRISTIDSFNHFLTSQLPVTSALGIIPEISDDTYILFREAVLDTLREVDNGTPLASALARLLGHFNNNWNALLHTLCVLLAKRDQWLGNILAIRREPDSARTLLEDTLNGLVEQTLAELERALMPYAADLLPLLDFALRNLGAQQDLGDSLPACRADCLGLWQEIGSLLLTNEHALRRQVDKRNGFPAPKDADNKPDRALREEMKTGMVNLLERMRADPALADLLVHFRHLPQPRFDDDQWLVLQSLTVILPELVSRLSLVFGRHVRVDHAHISAAALDALGDEDRPTDLALRLDYHLKHILVDEFQDTSSFQIHLLEKLTRGWQEGDGRTLFIVGDGMQSCYGFRNANVGLFLAARDHGIGQVRFESLQLVCNFRSRAPVVEWVNEIFSRAFPLRDDISRGAVSFHAAQAMHGAEGDCGVHITLLAADRDLPDAAAHKHRLEAALVADKVQALRTSNPQDSIAILVRTRSHLDEIIPALRARGLHWNANEIDPLDSYPAIRDLLMLARAMLNLADVPAWLALLRAPWVGLRLADIHALSRHAAGTGQSLWQAIHDFGAVDALSDEARQILSRLVPPLALARDNRQRLPLRQWLENLWLMLGGPASLEDASITGNIGQFFSLLERFDEGGDILDIHRFEQDVARVFGSGQHPDAGLHIMTIHRAKGLEFDHVLVPGLERRPRSNDNPLLLWKQHITGEGADRLVISLPARKSSEIGKDSIYQYLKYEMELEQRLENTRLLYIAVTRAIKQAFLFGGVTRKDDTLNDPAGQSLLHTIWTPLLPRMQEDFCRVINVADDIPVAPPEAEPAPPAIRTRRLPPDWQSPLAPDTPPPGLGTVLADLLADGAQHNLLEKRTGDIIHQCLKLIAEGRLDPEDAAAMGRLEQRWRLQLGACCEHPEEAVAAIRKQLVQCQAHERFAWLALEDHEGAGCELPISDFGGGRHRQYVVDRTFVDGNGVRWIIDYKSAQPQAGEALEAFLERQQEKYRPQLSTYAALYRTMETRPVRTALFFTALPCFHEIIQMS